MPRPADDEYFVESRTQHVAQGDIFMGVRIQHPQEEELSFETYGMLLNYTSGMLVGAEGTNREYRHIFRLVAPLFELALIQEVDERWTEEAIGHLRRGDRGAGWMYLPALPGEFEESAVALFRPVLLVQNQIEGTRVTQLQFPAARQLCLNLAKVYAAIDAEPEDVNPNMQDHWGGAP
jgi:hypothetical protein